MKPWDQLAGLMDGKVDDILGDDIAYKRGAAPAQTVKGFVLTIAEPQQVMEMMDDAIGERKRVKLNKSLPLLGGAQPARGDRLSSPKLGTGVWQPVGVEDDLETQGRYWIFDVQAAS